MSTKRLFIFILTLCCALSLQAQNASGRIRGKVIESDTSLPVIQGAVLLLNPKDSSMVEGTATDNDGLFSFDVPHGDYIIKISYIGFTPLCRDVHHVSSSSGLDLGILAISPDAQVLKSAVVSANAQLTTIVGDTLVYNPTALNMEEDATLKEILKKLPGVEVDGNSVLLNGKRINEIYVNGQRFFGGDVKSGLENLTADMIDHINAYERESDFTRTTGIDDGEYQPVLDVKVKKNMMDGWKGRINAGYGLHNRYTGRLNLSKFEKEKQDIILANANNEHGKISINNASRNQMGMGSSAENHYREGGYSFARKSKKLNVDGHLNYTGVNRDMTRRQRVRYFYATGPSFFNQNAWGDGVSHTPKGDARIEWRPTSQDNVTAKAAVKYTYSNTWNQYRGGSFKSDPYEIVDNPNQYLVYDSENDPLKSIRNYLNHNMDLYYGNNFTENVYAIYTHRFGKKGRSLSASFYENLTLTDSDSYVDKKTLNKGKESNPKLYKQLIKNEGRNMYFNCQLSYSEPLGKGFFLNLILKEEHRQNYSNRSFYDMGALANDWHIVWGMGRDEFRKTLPKGYEDTYRPDLCSYGTLEYDALTATANIRYTRKKFNVTFGASAVPQWSKLSFRETEGYESPVRKFMFNASPNLILNYNPSKRRKLTVRYRGWTSSVSLTNLLPIPSGTDPSYIKYGNPDLLQVFNQEGTLQYNSSNIKKHNSFILSLTYRNIQNSVATSTSYDPETGHRTVNPKNIDGNWWVSGYLTYNKTFKNERFSTSNHLSGQFKNNVSYLYNGKIKADEYNTTRRTMIKASSDWSYRIKWVELILNVYGDYSLEHSLLRPELDQQPFTLSGCMTATFTLPWKMRLSTDFSYIAQRGYAYKDLNRDYLLWNASLSQPFLKKKLTVRVEAFDILGQMVNMTNSVGAESRSINFYNGVNSYVILRLIYRFNNEKKKSKR